LGTVRKYCARWGISTDHFDPEAVIREHLAKRRLGAAPLAEIMVTGSTYPRVHLKRRLFADGLKERRCEMCGQGEEWRGARMGLILDHINGEADDHRLENLRILCPNCAATLDTHCGRKNRIRREPRPCGRCGREFFPRQDAQRYCSRACAGRWPRTSESHLHLRRVERPPYEQLLAEVEALGWSAVGRKYGVSDNAIRKWMRAYERELVASAGNGVPGRAAEDAAGLEGDAREAEVSRDLHEAGGGVERESRRVFPVKYQASGARSSVQRTRSSVRAPCGSARGSPIACTRWCAPGLPAT
jgi:transposase-like protein